MKIEIEHEGSCLGATGGTGRLIVQDRFAVPLPTTSNAENRCSRYGCASAPRARPWKIRNGFAEWLNDVRAGEGSAAGFLKLRAVSWSAVNRTSPSSNEDLYKRAVPQTNDGVHGYDERLRGSSDVTKGKRMEPTSRKDTSTLRTAAPTQLPADNRISSGSVVAGSPSGSDAQVRISKLAYYKAQQRGFAPGHEWEDWFAAEREVRGSR